MFCLAPKVYIMLSCDNHLFFISNVLLGHWHRPSLIHCSTYIDVTIYVMMLHDTTDVSMVLLISAEPYIYDWNSKTTI